MPDLLEFTTDLAESTGIILLNYYNPSGLQAELKADKTAVTEADFAADRYITKCIRENFPQDEIISEESSYQIKNINSPVWIIDPLDGTTNFSLGLPIWGVSIARIENGFPRLGILYFPLLHELYTCMHGGGAYLNRSLITVKQPDPAIPLSFFACCSRSFRKYDISIPYKPRILGSGAYTFCMVARGSALLGLDSASKLWDLAAGWLLVEEAGGTVKALESTNPFPLIQSTDYRDREYPILAAASDTVYSFGTNNIRKKNSY